MLTSLIASVALLAAPTATRYDVGERVKLLDRAWLAVQDSPHRAKAVPFIRSALGSFFSDKYEEACRSLDEAAAVLEGREPATEDAVTLRFDPPFAEPKTVCYLRVSWAYAPKGSRPIRVGIGSQSVLATPGRPLTLEVHPERLNSELLMSPEVGYLVPVRVGSETKGAYISLIKRPRTRIASLLSAKLPEARQMAAGLSQLVADSKAAEGDVPVIQQLFTAEMLEEGRLKLDHAEQLSSLREGSTVFRAIFPKSSLGSTSPVNVVIALPGAGWSENTFFDGYGNGLAVQEALRRGWALISPRTGEHSVADCLRWLQTRRGLKIGKVFLLGHSTGAAVALAASDRANGVAALAPVGSAQIPASGVPVYLAVGKQDALVLTSTRQLATSLAGRARSSYEEFEPCEHLMIVADAIPAAFRFFAGL